MDYNKKTVKTQMTVGESPWGYGYVTGAFEAATYEGVLLDTRVELSIKPFCITWANKEKLLKEISAVISKYQI